MEESYRGHIYASGRYAPPEILQGVVGITRFIKKNITAEEIRVTDSKDNLIFHAMGGVDLYSELNRVGIDLPAIYREIRKDAIAEYRAPESSAEAWEIYYDSIGLSPREIQMRQTVKVGARAARTVADAVAIITGTYFDLHFTTEDGKRTWGYFNSADYTVADTTAGDRSEKRRLRLDQAARVAFTGGGEDVLGFVILDPPADS